MSALVCAPRMYYWVNLPSLCHDCFQSGEEEESEEESDFKPSDFESEEEEDSEEDSEESENWSAEEDEDGQCSQTRVYFLGKRRRVCSWGWAKLGFQNQVYNTNFLKN